MIILRKILDWIISKQHIIGLISTVIIILLTIYGYTQGVFTDKHKLETLLKSCGIWAPAVFIALQAIQVVIPILPGSIGCLFGVVFFGAFKGFIYNYIGICGGSVWAFLIAKAYGREFVKRVTSEKFYAKYSPYMNSPKFAVIFAVLIFLPVAPDDFLCYLAGLTDMKLSKFTLIILLGKPLAIFLYSFALTKIYTYAIHFIS